MKPGTTFTITTSRRDGSVRLSMAGQWGNMPMASADAAEAEAKRLGGAGADIRRGWAR